MSSAANNPNSLHESLREPRFFEIVDSRLELHGNISPAVYSTHARERLIPLIEGLPFPEDPIADPYYLASCDVVKRGLSLGGDDVTDFSQQDGVYHADKYFVFRKGYGDMHITALAGAAIGKTISDFFVGNCITSEQFTLTDYGKLFQTGWFGTILNQMALTEGGLWGPYLDNNSQVTSDVFRDWSEKPPFEMIPLLKLVKDESSGKYIAELTRETKVELRSRIERDKSVGCPVARTAFTATQEQLDFLNYFGHIGDRSGFQPDEELTASGLRKITQGPYTAIDDVAWHWGAYILRYARFLAKSLDGSVNLDRIRETNVGSTVLIDHEEAA